MARIYDRRKESRYKVSASIIYQINLSGTDYPAKKSDHSCTGVSFWSNHDLKPGTVVYVRHGGCPPGCQGGDMCEGCRTATLATVKWCRQSQNTDREMYCVGVKYL